MRESLELMKERIAALESAGVKVADDTIDKIEKDVVSYATNKELLEQMGLELEDNELRNFDAYLYSPNLKTSMDILKRYSISIMCSNGRYDLKSLIKGNALTTDLDDLIEAGLEDLISYNPRVLALNIDGVLKRKEYLASHNVAIKESDGYNDMLVDFTEFHDKYGYDVETPSLNERANGRIGTMSDNSEYTKILVDLLENSYQEEGNIYDKINASVEVEEKVNEILDNINRTLKAEDTSKYAYKIGNKLVSKEKVVRNVSLLVSNLLSKGESLEGIEREILLVSALYGLRATEQELTQIGELCLGFNEEKTLGGLAA